VQPEDVATCLRTGRLVPDDAFDAWLPAELARASRRFWTPLGVAARVTRWLGELGVRSVLDVGSGVGKFCVAGALCSPLRFTGVEQRGRLVAAARELARRFGVGERVRFVHGLLNAEDFRRFDAVYFYNPFGENICPVNDRLDEQVELCRARFDREITQVEELLAAMPVGSYLATYNGYGGRVPDSFELLRERLAGRNLLRLWHKARKERTGGYWLELPDATLHREPRKRGSKQPA
jgi:SAM-dependent methyltransferase